MYRVSYCRRPQRRLHGLPASGLLVDDLLARGGDRLDARHEGVRASGRGAGSGTTGRRVAYLQLEILIRSL